jgi:alkanesulfonate monooxygenase SsuD/methylene tetrahydromethanopterin reductase-like flavin-dependent oxidoreductase (luciferase family)
MQSEAVRFGLWYDFRNPASGDTSFTDLYRETLEQIAWAERLGFDSVWLTEHHFTDDGYTPSPLVLAGAIAARTERIQIGTNLMLLPLHDPVRLAEDAATVSLASGGRFSLGVGLGYRELEFDAFHRSLRNRPSLLEEGVEVIRRAWSGRPLSFAGRRFQAPDVVVTPQPEQPLPLLVGGMVQPAIERVARVGDGFLSTQNAHHDLYLDAHRVRHGDLDAARIYAGQWIVVAEDPEREWAEIGRHALYQINEYISWGAFGPPDQMPRFADPQQIVDAGAYQLLDAHGAALMLADLVRARPQIRDVHLWAQLPGERVEHGSRRVEYFASRVIPEVRARLQAAAAT